jgi:hypothetical protein
MGLCDCCGDKGEQDLKDIRAEKSAQAFKAGGDNDISKGPAGNRHCTDLWCCIVFVVAIVMYVIVTFIGFGYGNLDRLYKPRDAMGNYCGLEENWNNGPNLVNNEFMTYTMNVSKVTDAIMKQVVCSSGAQRVMRQRKTEQAITATELDNYLKACCAVPTEECQRAIEQFDPSVGISSLTDATSAITSLAAARMQELVGLSNVDVATLFSPSGANGDLFSGEAFWQEITSSVHHVCMKECTVSYESIAAANGTTTSYPFRTYTYAPIPGSEFRIAWDQLRSDPNLGGVINASFTYKALSKDDCGYDDPVWCVPMPGIAFENVALNYCTLRMAAEVVTSLGDTVTQILESDALTSISNEATASLGEQWGSIQQSLPALLIVVVVAFAIGMVFLVLVRFFVAPCVWISIFSVAVMIAFFGFLCYVKSIQCAGAGLLDTGLQTGTQVVTYATTQVDQAISGETVSEALTGNGADYRGVQSVTRYGTRCQRWDSNSPHEIADPAFGEAPYNASYGIGSHSYCRNPYTADSTIRAGTIWCFTQNPDLVWEECLPIGLEAPECKDGYAVTGQTARDVLLYSCYGFLILSGIWLLIVVCFCKQILLTIRITKVGARFLAETPTVLLVPAAQSLWAALFCIAWFYGAAFILSQVPDDYTPSGWYTDYNTAWTACTYEGSGNWGYPVSDPYRDESCAGPDGECWRCSQPRYNLTVPFFYVFFIFLWINAFTVAFGQTTIAGAVCSWFFKCPGSGKIGGALRDSTWIVCRYHSGSLAFGSFIIAVVQFIRYSLMLLEKQAQARKNRVMVIVARVVQCLVWCFEKSLEYINKLAYIQIALLGTNFCTSAKKAFYLLLRHAVRFASVAALGTAIDYVGWLAILTGTVVCGYMIQVSLYPEVSPVAPVLLYIILGHIVGSLFMNVFHLAIDASLQCFIVTEEMGIDDAHVPRELKAVCPTKAPKEDANAESSSVPATPREQEEKQSKVERL